MKPNPIESKKEYEAYLDWIDKQFDDKVKANSSEGQKLKEILSLIKEYEDKHYPIPKS